MALKKQKEQILLDLIQEYIDTAHAVASNTLLKKRGYNLSSATIRNWMVEFEQIGFLRQPHISSGRVPTVKAYKFFVQNLTIFDENVKPSEPSELIDEDIKSFNPEQVIKYLSNKTNAMAFAKISDDKTFYQSGLRLLLNEPEFSDIEMVKKLIDFTENFENKIDKLASQQHNINIVVGDKDKMPFSIMLFEADFEKANNATIGIIGPLRMDYNYNLQVLESLKNIVNS